MNIGIYTSLAAKPAGNELNTSGHVQLPIKTAQLLEDAGHSAELITTEPPPGYTYPAGLEQAMRIHEVADGRRTRDPLLGSARKRPALSLAVRQIGEIRRLDRRRRFDVLHLFGFGGTAILAAALRAAGSNTPIVMTLPTFTTTAGITGTATRVALASLDGVATATEFAAIQLRRVGIRPQILRHGPVRDLRRRAVSDADRSRVLFWRDLSAQNGADIAIEAFGTLAPRFPQISFDFAIRPGATEVGGLADLFARNENVGVHRYPYLSGPSLEDLIAESVVVVLPFRQTSIDPQFSVMESLDAGVPVISTRVGSMPELIHAGVNGWLVPPSDPQRLAAAVTAALEHPDRCLRMGRVARETLRSEWNWDRYTSELLDFYSRSVLSRSNESI